MRVMVVSQEVVPFGRHRALIDTASNDMYNPGSLFLSFDISITPQKDPNQSITTATNPESIFLLCSILLAHHSNPPIHQSTQTAPFLHGTEAPNTYT